MRRLQHRKHTFIAACALAGVSLVGCLTLAAPSPEAVAVGTPHGALHLQQDDPIDIIDWPITYDDERARLTSAFLTRHVTRFRPSGDVWTDARMIPRVVVLHHTAGPTALGAWTTFQKAATGRADREDHQRLNTSTQFLVDRDGTIYRLYDETLTGRHAIGLNHLAIGVENVGGIEGHPLTDAQVTANVALIRHLRAKYPTITHVVGHHETRRMEAHPYFDERDPNYRTVKIDPGDAFMREVRAGIADLALSGPPGTDGLAHGESRGPAAASRG